MLDRRKYLGRIIDEAGEVLLVVATEHQARKLEERLDGRKGVQVGTVERIPAEARPEEVVLLDPPSNLDLLQHPALREARRVHLLFGDQEMERERARRSALWMDRGRMERVWKALARFARGGGLREGDLDRVARELQAEDTVDTVRAALGILEELGVAQRGPDGRIRLGPGSGRRLEESRRYRELERLRLEFQEVRRAFWRRRVDLARFGESRGA